MDRHEKKRLRDYIGEYLDVSSTRLTDEEATFLSDFLDVYDETLQGAHVHPHQEPSRLELRREVHTE
ncbi:hypothetical protein [Streptomyces halstedii]|uniref:hypothetical protein n=1 Tax=Streptomyces halstedii TaxID=1944 RepID=UPI0037FDC7A4